MSSNTELIITMIGAITTAITAIIHAVTHAIYIIKYGKKNDNLSPKQIANRDKRAQKYIKKAEKLKSNKSNMFINQ